MSQSPYNHLGVFLVADLPQAAVNTTDVDRETYATCGVFHGMYLEVQDETVRQMLKIDAAEELWVGFQLVESPPFTGDPVLVIKQGGRGAISIATRDLDDEGQARDVVTRARQVYGEECASEDIQGDVVRLTRCRAPLGFVRLERTEATVMITCAIDEATCTAYMRRFPNGYAPAEITKRLIAGKRSRPSTKHALGASGNDAQ
jgi:hypothetical protein